MKQQRWKIPNNLTHHRKLIPIPKLLVFTFKDIVLEVGTKLYILALLAYVEMGILYSRSLVLWCNNLRSHLWCFCRKKPATFTFLHFLIPGVFYPSENIEKTFKVYSFIHGHSKRQGEISLSGDGFNFRDLCNYQACGILVNKPADYLE